MARYSSTEHTGVHAVGGIVTSNFDWIFREQPIADMGIDAHIERVDDGTPTGKLIGVQIKTGESHFTDNGEGLVYYGSLAHLDYWLGHRLPVLLIAHLPATVATYWVHVEPGAVERTPKAWKITIPKANLLGTTESFAAITMIFEGTKRDLKLRRLSFDEPLMRQIADGRKVSVEVEDWYNKTSANA